MAKRYDVRINNPNNERDCILIVCPPSHDQQGAKFRATIESLHGRYNLRCIWIADALDEHNSGSLLLALQRGQEWIDRHNHLLGNTPIRRWQEVRRHPDFAAKYDEVKRLYHECLAARAAIDDICHTHAITIAARQIARGLAPDHSSLMSRCINYMLEEIAGLSIIRDLGDLPEIYPGAHFSDPDIFHRIARISLRLPRVIPLSFRAHQPSLTLKSAI